MGHLQERSLISLLAIWLALPASAQDRSLELPTPSAAILPSNTPTALTGKERLGKKWMDEQRIDNCKVPIDKRGPSRDPAPAPMFRRDDDTDAHTSGCMRLDSPFRSINN